MRVLLVTWTDGLRDKLSILSSELEYCAIVVDEVEPAKEILEQFGLSKTLLHPFYDLKECIRDFYYDFFICLTNTNTLQLLPKQAENYGVPHNKFLHFSDLNSIVPFSLKLQMDYYQRHAKEILILATGISYSAEALIQARFKHKLINFAYGSQDMYYDFQIAKRTILWGGE